MGRIWSDIVRYPSRLHALTPFGGQAVASCASITHTSSTELLQIRQATCRGAQWPPRASCNCTACLGLVSVHLFLKPSPTTPCRYACTLPASNSCYPIAVAPLAAIRYSRSACSSAVTILPFFPRLKTPSAWVPSLNMHESSLEVHEPCVSFLFPRLANLLG
ncbi:hypothetical protein BU16DRAFT_240294 [Lophium mytilinum]|uniref:Uncharacterized protein n=1 Tax=Lophium mytilinum TaxID=390894 RepID=A0A6A6R917_9PEZI|nr:hypothetical protein BU16DRAFT_240294 [Lophium mytilinum]